MNGWIGNTIQYLACRACALLGVADVVTDYIDGDIPDYRGAWRAWRTLRRAGLTRSSGGSQ